MVKCKIAKPLRDTKSFKGFCYCANNLTNNLNQSIMHLIFYMRFSKWKC